MALPIGTPRPCKGCGTTIYKSKFCTNDCRVAWYARTARSRDLARDRAKGVLPFRERYPVERTLERKCEHCGCAFVRRCRPKDAARFCSKKCAGAWRTIRKKPKEGTPRLCICGQALPAGRQRHDQCRTVFRLGKPCRDCGALIEKGAQRCDACRQAAVERNKTSEIAVRNRRIGRQVRRARERAAVVERFDPFEIFNRDKWRCHLCGARTLKRMRGSCHDRAPEIDHIVPLAAGGEHSRLNTACVCRKCNIAKGARPLGQLRLVA